MVPTLDQLKSISKATKFTPAILSNMNSVIVGLQTYGERFGLDLPHRLAKYLGQLSHEGGGFKYDREIWGNTPAQQKYDTRTDLGNTKAKDGDGKLYMGRAGIQLTGKGNYEAFTKWAKSIDPNAPDFVKNPELINTDPWEGLVPIWYWSVGNPTGKSLNIYADENNDEMITRRINGGLNGFDDRIDYTIRASLVLLGYGPEQVKVFQQKVFTSPDSFDGIPGPQTRSKLHEALANKARSAIAEDPAIEVKKAPVVQKEEVAVTPPGVDKPGKDIGVVIGTVVTGTAGPKIAEQILPTFGGLSQMVQLALVCVAVAGVAWFIVRRYGLANKATAIIDRIAEKKADGLPN